MVSHISASYTHRALTEVTQMSIALLPFRAAEDSDNEEEWDDDEDWDDDEEDLESGEEE